MMKCDPEKFFPKQIRKYNKQQQNKDKMVSQTHKMGHNLWKYRGIIVHKNMAFEGVKKEVEAMVHELETMIDEECSLPYGNVNKNQSH